MTNSASPNDDGVAISHMMSSSSTSNQSVLPSSPADQVNNSLTLSSPNISHSPPLPKPQMGTSAHGIFLDKETTPTLHAFSNFDWASNSDDRTLTSAYIVFIGASPISWVSKKQLIVARSSTEAKYRANASTATELNWLTNFLQEIQVVDTSIPTIYCDNIGATNLCKNPVFHSCMKQIAIDFHFVYDQVLHHWLRVSHVHTNDQLADSLTKALARKQFLLHRSKIGIRAVKGCVNYGVGAVSDRVGVKDGDSVAECVSAGDGVAECVSAGDGVAECVSDGGVLNIH
ncbi:hypothetical protein LWI29_022288 [Acer saccharum]|uniref:Uncharacterized protein n=1 Tax=Acer saccharum TaxID=4024 RepID=A0AA39W623_ACESA|nr:hypothetical protein LWI29_022288 [Acer saccharum]